VMEEWKTGRWGERERGRWRRWNVKLGMRNLSILDCGLRPPASRAYAPEGMLNQSAERIA